MVRLSPYGSSKRCRDLRQPGSGGAVGTAEGSATGDVELSGGDVATSGSTHSSGGASPESCRGWSWDPEFRPTMAAGVPQH